MRLRPHAWPAATPRRAPSPCLQPSTPFVAPLTVAPFPAPRPRTWPAAPPRRTHSSRPPPRASVARLASRPSPARPLNAPPTAARPPSASGCRGWCAWPRRCAWPQRQWVARAAGAWPAHHHGLPWPWTVDAPPPTSPRSTKLLRVTGCPIPADTRRARARFFAHGHAGGWA
jgi:hypothetical protein